MKEHKKCPWCGGDGKILKTRITDMQDYEVREDDRMLYSHTVLCQACGVHLPWTPGNTSESQSIYDAWLRWDTRIEVDKHIDDGHVYECEKQGLVKK